MAHIMSYINSIYIVFDMIHVICIIVNIDIVLTIINRIFFSFTKYSREKGAIWLQHLLSGTRFIKC